MATLHISYHLAHCAEKAEICAYKPTLNMRYRIGHNIIFLSVMKWKNICLNFFAFNVNSHPQIYMFV